MSHDDNEMRAMLRGFVPEVPGYLAQRIIANATAQPQQRGLFAYFTQAMSEWNYALAYKGMALACFMMLGVALAQNQTQVLNYASPMDMSRLVVAQGWMEE